MAFITVENMWKMQWKGQTIGALKETRCHSKTIEVPLVENVFKEFDWLGLMYPPFWFSMLKSKIGYAHITGSNSRSN